MVLALLATTAAAFLLGACGQTTGLFSKSSAPEVQMSAAEAAKATSQWAVAYERNPRDPRAALGYARSLRALGSKERSLEILRTAYQTNPNEGAVAAELGRVALEMGRFDIASQALKSAEADGAADWKTLSAQGTLLARKGEYGEAQKYYQAALEKQPDSVSVINNLALSYALDGKAAESEALLRKAIDNGADDKRIRQNLALVLGIQGKFDQAREIASVDMTDAQAKSNVAYLRDMLSSPRQVAAAAPKSESVEDWSPFGSNAPVKAEASTQSATNLDVAPKVANVEPFEMQSPAVNNAKPIRPERSASKKVAKAQIANPVKTSVAEKTAEVPENESNASSGAPTDVTPADLLKTDL
jgi:Flp pilus assembly protein TadD